MGKLTFTAIYTTSRHLSLRRNRFSMRYLERLHYISYVASDQRFHASAEIPFGLTYSIQSNEIGNKDEKHLTPAKLAAFYKVAGFNYDSEWT
jgi:hypothetical protein